MTLTAERVRAQPARPARLRKLPGLDGLRAIAVIAVIGYHLEPHWLPGGYLGVDIFFVISGYLITSILLSEYNQGPSVSLPRFWARRARRLLPAVVVLLLSVVVLSAIFARDALGAMQGDVPAAIFYVLNWHLVFSHASYQSSFGRPPLLQHLWSLSVEEQFYVLWPPILIIMRHRMPAARVARWAFGAALFSALLMAILFHPGGNPSGVYFASDTHAEGLLIGCALAAAIPPWRMAASVSTGARHILERAGIFALALAVVGLCTISFTSTFAYRGGMLLVDLATAVVVATVAHPASRLGDVLSRQPLRWIGLRSYSLYLWHWPILQLTRPGVDWSLTGFPDALVRLLLIGLAAELSYQLVEQPWRTGKAQFMLRVRIASASKRRVAAVVVIPVAALVAMLATAPPSGEPAILSEGSTPAARINPDLTLTLSPPAPDPATWAPGSSRSPHPARVHPVAPAGPGATVAKAPAPLTGLPASEPILAIGDSVLLAASPSLSATFGPSITVDASVGRQVDAGLARLATYRASGALQHYRSVLIDLGTNGTFSPAQFQQLTALVAGVPRVLVLDVHAARSWVAVSNATITSGVAADAAQMRMVDWNGAAGAGLLYSDGIHPNPAGAAVYTNLITTALTRWPAPPG